jgi:hypothetical protein
MKKTVGVLVLVTACLFLVAADNGRTTRSAAGVYDANGRFVGTLVDTATFAPSTPEITVYVPSIQKVVPLDWQGNVGSMSLFYSSGDCSGTPYSIPTVLDNSVVREFRSGLYTMRSFGNPPPNLALFRSFYTDHHCAAVVTGLDSRYYPMVLEPVNQPLPFTVPLAQPVTLK